MKKVMFTVIALLNCGTAYAADKSEAGVPTSPLAIYSGGVNVGVLRAASDELKDVSENFLKLSFTNNVSVRNNLALFIDVDWLIPDPDKNFGADVGFDFIFSDTDFRPFAGIGVGGHCFDHGGAFGDDFGPSFTAHFGFSLDLNENIALRIRAPYHFTMNEANDVMAGLDFAFLFSSKYKNVKKLNYN